MDLLPHELVHPNEPISILARSIDLDLQPQQVHPNEPSLNESMGFPVALKHSNMLMVSLPYMQAFTVHPKAFLQGESVTDDRHYTQALRRTYT